MNQLQILKSEKLVFQTAKMKTVLPLSLSESEGGEKLQIKIFNMFDIYYVYPATVHFNIKKYIIINQAAENV